MTHREHHSTAAPRSTSGGRRFRIVSEGAPAACFPPWAAGAVRVVEGLPATPLEPSARRHAQTAMDWLAATNASQHAVEESFLAAGCALRGDRLAIAIHTRWVSWWGAAEAPNPAAAANLLTEAIEHAGPLIDQRSVGFEAVATAKWDRALFSLGPRWRACRRQVNCPSWSDLLLGRVEVVGASPHPTRDVIFPGSFAPPHAGHWRMAELAGRMLGRLPAFEISVVNVDKPPLDLFSLGERGEWMRGRPHWLTRAATFVEKAEIFPGATFVVGADTALRLGDSRYYADSQSRDAAIERIVARGCRFLVFGRLIDGAFRELDGLDLPPALRAVCEGAPESLFRNDLSSTRLRAGGENPSPDERVTPPGGAPKRSAEGDSAEPPGPPARP